MSLNSYPNPPDKGAAPLNGLVKNFPIFERNKIIDIFWRKDCTVLGKRENKRIIEVPCKHRVRGPKHITAKI